MTKKKAKKVTEITETLEKPEIVLPQRVANSNAQLVKLGYAQATKTNSLGQIIDMQIELPGIARFMADVVTKFSGLGE